MPLFCWTNPIIVPDATSPNRKTSKLGVTLLGTHSLQSQGYPDFTPWALTSDISTVRDFNHHFLTGGMVEQTKMEQMTFANMCYESLDKWRLIPLYIFVCIWYLYVKLLPWRWMFQHWIAVGGEERQKWAGGFKCFLSFYPETLGFHDPIWRTRICFKWVGEKPTTRQWAAGGYSIHYTFRGYIDFDRVWIRNISEKKRTYQY